MDLHHFDGKNLLVWMFQLQQNFLYYIPSIEHLIVAFHYRIHHAPPRLCALRTCWRWWAGGFETSVSFPLQLGSGGKSA